MIWTEWDKLTEVIVGRAYDPNQFANEATNLDWADNEFIDGMSRIFSETNEDLDKLSNIFSSNGIKVHRPKNLPFKVEQTRMWTAFTPTPGVVPRDMHFAYGETILSTIGGDINRFNESDFFTQIMLQKYTQGRNLISMPRPLLGEKYRNYQEMEGQILYHSANLLKCGDAILYSIPYGDGKQGKGTKAGIEWVKRNIGYDVDWIEFKRSGHADGGICLIKPGLLMVKDVSLIPEKLSSWDVIQIDQKEIPEWFNTLTAKGFYKDKVKHWLNTWIGHVEETAFDINGLSLDSNTLMTNGYDKEMAKKLKKYGVELLPFEFRHRFFYDSGLHCVTLDLSRNGTRDKYI